MTSADDLLAALPIREIRVRAGSYGNCGGVIIAVADLERGSTEGVEVVDAVTELPDWSTDFPDDVDLCVHSIGRGVKAALVDRFGGEPPVRLVLRGLRFSPVTWSRPSGGRRAGSS
ncbi:hypothetical protein LX16_4440 [Stackebrandtia albiflava]|uniref:Uncharacterized protein n=1 Tax=Stackebrandtia albiflava TaxID=406432 RepID=A0A562URI1_9ACTN|nr:hypothetical protein [Stackebrandtia albiflava]TWJ08217.1 hypothetical protein LX16_4440 [Stackebrandtia albiflava]